MDGKLDEIGVAAKPGVSDRQLAQELGNILPAKHTGSHGRATGTKRREGHELLFSFLRTFLLSFGGIALFVGAFVIANSFSITIAQRTESWRRFAPLSVPQEALKSIILEAIVVGVLASVVGLFLGLGLAKALFGSST